MRLSDSQRQIIKSAVARIVGAESRVWLFGSRTDDAQRGGDIDLLVETDQVIPDRVGVLCKLEGTLTMGLGDRKIDVVLKDARTGEAPIFDAAREKGILL
jgi:predicted nucleotidyltransferase